MQVCHGGGDGRFPQPTGTESAPDTCYRLWNWRTEGLHERYRRRRSGFDPADLWNGYCTWLAYAGVALLAWFMQALRRLPRTLARAASSTRQGIARTALSRDRAFAKRCRRWPYMDFGTQWKPSGPCCGFQRLLNLNPIMRPSEAVLQQGLLYVAAGLAALMVGYYVVGLNLFRGVRPFAFAKRPPENANEPFAWATAAMAVIFWIAARVTGEYLSAISNAVIDFAVIVLAYLVFSRKLSVIGRLFFWTLFVPSLVLFRQDIDKGFLYGIMITVVIFVLVYVRIWKRIPWAALLVPVLILLFFQPAKGRFRADMEERADLSRIQRYQIFVQYAMDYYSGVAPMQTADSGRFYDKTFERIDNLVLTCAVMEATPDRIPYWNGETYYPLVTKWIPRFIWPDKPREDLGNRWAHFYGLLDSTDFITSINLPWLPEFYINFGLMGIVLGMFGVGMVFAFMHHWIWNTPRGLAEYGFGFVLAQSLFFVESHLSVMAGATIIAAVSLFILVRLPIAVARKSAGAAQVCQA